MHTPYSFSAFDGVTQALDMAAEEGVKVVGINDFYSMDGYREWCEECGKRHLFPLFNIEFISLNVADQAAGVRVNDPNNPGRTYLSGKGLAYPVILRGREAEQLAAVRAESNAQVERMCAKLNEHLDAVGAGFNISFAQVRDTLTRGSIRERHLAKALRLAVDAHCQAEAGKLSLYEKIFGGKPLKSDPADVAAVENEIRSKLLKSGGAPEDLQPMQTSPCGAGKLMVKAYFNGVLIWDYYRGVEIRNEAFSALPWGYAQIEDGRYSFYDYDDYAIFWTSDEYEGRGVYRYIFEQYDNVYVGTADKQTFAANVRCVR